MSSYACMRVTLQNLCVGHHGRNHFFWELRYRRFEYDIVENYDIGTYDIVENYDIGGGKVPDAEFGGDLIMVSKSERAD